MQVTVETTEGLERKMSVVVPSDLVETQVTAKIKETALRAKINGFRPGKVPMREVKRRFGAGIRQEVSSEVIQSTYGEALQKEDITPAGMPRIEDVKIEEGQDLEYVAFFEVFPDVEVKPFDTISVERLSTTIEESDLDKMIETLREQRKEYVIVERAAAADDQVNIDFEGFVDGEAFDGGQAEGNDIVIGSGSMIPGFEDGIQGLSAGDEKELEVTFPEEYQAENLAGKAATFKIKVNSVSESQLPELNEAFFEQFEVTEGGMEAFREEVKGNMTRELDQAITAKVKNQVMDGLDSDNEVILPSALIDQEIDRMRQEAVQQFGGGAQFDPSMLPAEMFKDQAEKRVKIGLLVSSIVEKYEMRPDDAKVKETIEKMASQYQDPEQVKNFYYSNEQQMNQIQNMVLEDQLVDFILETATVTDKTVTYDEAIKREEPPMADDSAQEDADEAIEEEKS
ncbi:MAG: trigger factor [Candidatus Azotimanducaceae bacterium]|jgi:trigger factor